MQWEPGFKRKGTVFTKPTRQVSDLNLLQVLGVHPNPTRALGREGLGKEVPAACRPCPLWAKVSSSVNGGNSECHSAEQHSEGGAWS